MIKRSSFLLFIALVAICGPQAIAANQFIPLGVYPNGVFWSGATAISGDGSKVTVDGIEVPSGQDFSHVFLWTEPTGLVSLHPAPLIDAPSTVSSGVSNSGVIAGTLHVLYYAPQAFRWNSEVGLVGLGFLDGGLDVDSRANGISDDGMTIVGNSSSANGFEEAMYWTEATGMVGLGDLPGAEFRSTANAISTNGSIIVGQGNSDLGPEAFYWTASTGVVGLGDLPGGEYESEAVDVSNDGSVIVGNGASIQSAQAREAFRWTTSEGMAPLGTLAGARPYSYAHATSADGSIVVGTSDGSVDSIYDDAFVWDASHGMRNLQAVLSSSFGLANELAGWQLTVATDLSADGLSIVGRGFNPSGVLEAWLVRLNHPMHVPEPASLFPIILGVLLVWRIGFGRAQKEKLRKCARKPGTVLHPARIPKLFAEIGHAIC